MHIRAVCAATQSSVNEVGAFANDVFSSAGDPPGVFVVDTAEQRLCHPDRDLPQCRTLDGRPFISGQFALCGEPTTRTCARSSARRTTRSKP